QLRGQQAAQSPHRVRYRRDRRRAAGGLHAAVRREPEATLIALRSPRMAAHLGDETIAAYVDGLLDSDAIVRADAHIAPCATCREQLSAMAGSPSLHSFVGGAAATAATLPALATVRAGDPVPDAQLGRYVVASVIGRGAMGVVVRARDPELERDVAIKLVD